MLNLEGKKFIIFIMFCSLSAWSTERSWFMLKYMTGATDRF